MLGCSCAPRTLFNMPGHAVFFRTDPSHFMATSDRPQSRNSPGESFLVGSIQMPQELRRAKLPICFKRYRWSDRAHGEKELYVLFQLESAWLNTKVPPFSFSCAGSNQLSISIARPLFETIQITASSASIFRIPAWQASPVMANMFEAYGIKLAHVFAAFGQDAQLN